MTTYFNHCQNDMYANGPHDCDIHNATNFVSGARYYDLPCNSCAGHGDVCAQCGAGECYCDPDTLELSLVKCDECNGKGTR
jgi:hypothetical protein